MGYYAAEFRMVSHLSRHNSRRDRIDDLLYEELVERIRGITDEHRYEHLNILITDGIDWGDDDE